MKIASLSSYSGINFKRFVVVVVVIIILITTTTTIRMIIIIKSLTTDCTKLTSGCILCVIDDSEVIFSLVHTRSIFSVVLTFKFLKC